MNYTVQRHFPSCWHYARWSLAKSSIDRAAFVEATPLDPPRQSRLPLWTASGDEIAMDPTEVIGRVF